MWFLGFFFAVKNCWLKLETSGDVPVGRRSHSAGELSMFQSSVLDIREVKHCLLFAVCRFKMDYFFLSFVYK